MISHPFCFACHIMVIRVMLLGVEEIQTDRNNLSEIVTLPTHYFPNSVLHAPAFTAVTASGMEVEAGQLLW